MTQERWYDKTAEQVCERLGVNPASGLTRKGAASRLKKAGLNSIYPIPKGDFKTYLSHILTDFTSILLIVTAGISAVLEHNMQAAMMIIVLLVNLSASVFTYVKAQRVLEGMGHFALPVAKVMREGKLYLVRQEQLVPGDIIYISAGDIVPCDARLLECDGLCALETALTGITRTVTKDAAFVDQHDIAPAMQRNMLFASTILTEGGGKAVVCGTGTDTLVTRMDKNTTIVSHDKLSVIATLKKYCSVWSLAMIAVIFGLTVLDLILGLKSRGIFDIFLSGLSLAVASMSELYMAFGYIIIACGIFNAAKRFHDVNSGALIKNSAKLEVLKNITCLVVPKENVFALPEYTAEQIWCGGIFYDDAHSDKNGLGEKCSNVILTALLSTGLYGSKKLESNNMKSENIYTPEEDAIIRLGEKYGVYNVTLDERYPLRDHERIGEYSRFETSLVETADGFHVACRGEAAALIDRCDYYSVSGRVMPLDHELRTSIKIAASQLVREAYKVVGCASGKTVYNNLVRITACQNGLIFEGFIAIREPILPGAAKSVSKLRQSGVKVIMTCEDDGENNFYYASALGVANNATDVVTGEEVQNMRPGIFRVNASLYKVYEGLSIAQKRTLVQNLRDNGEVVGVLGRELDEIILLRDADVGFSQSVTISTKSGNSGVDITSRKAPVYVKTSRDSAKSGCEALKFISDVIVSQTDRDGHGGFNAISAAIQCAKVVYQNLLRMVKYLLTAQCARFFIVLYSVLSHTELFTAPQILLSGLMTDFLAVLIIAFERPSLDILSQKENTEEKLRRPLAHNLRSLLFGMFWASSTVLMPMAFTAAGYPLGDGDMLSYVFISFTLSQIVTLSETMKERSVFIPNVRFNRVYIASIAIIAAFTAVCVLIPQAGALFGLASGAARMWLCSFCVSASVLAVFEIFKAIYYSVKKSDK
ncbi:MAG: cation transporting ATPase C-terminal domain-containing protein [Eubacteriales bacterium]